MKIDKPRIRYLVGLIIGIPLVCTLIFFLAGLVGAVVLGAFGVLSHGQAMFLCLYFTAGGFVIGIISTAQKIQQALRVFRACDKIEGKKV
jgi:hypothetical protein